MKSGIPAFPPGTRPGGWFRGHAWVLAIAISVLTPREAHVSAPQTSSLHSDYFVMFGISGAAELGNTLASLKAQADEVLKKSPDGVVLAPYRDGMPPCSLQHGGTTPCTEKFSFEGDAFEISIHVAVKAALSDSVKDALGEALAHGMSVSLMKPPTAPVIWRGILFETEVQPNRYSPNPDPLAELGSGKNHPLLRYPNGNVKMGVLAKDAVIQGIEINPGRLVFFYPGGQLQKVSGLGAERKVNGVRVGGRDVLYFREDGAVERVDPVEDPPPSP